MKPLKSKLTRASVERRLVDGGTIRVRGVAYTLSGVYVIPRGATYAEAEGSPFMQFLDKHWPVPLDLRERGADRYWRSTVRALGVGDTYPGCYAVGRAPGTDGFPHHRVVRCIMAPTVTIATRTVDSCLNSCITVMTEIGMVVDPVCFVSPASGIALRERIEKQRHLHAAMIEMVTTNSVARVAALLPTRFA